MRRLLRRPGSTPSRRRSRHRRRRPAAPWDARPTRTRAGCLSRPAAGASNGVPAPPTASNRPPGSAARFPPVPLHHLGHALGGEPFPVSQGRVPHERRHRSAGAEPERWVGPGGRNGRGTGGPHGSGGRSSRATGGATKRCGPMNAHRGAPVRPDRVGEDVQPRQLDQGRGVADPGDPHLAVPHRCSPVHAGHPVGVNGATPRPVGSGGRFPRIHSRATRPMLRRSASSPAAMGHGFRKTPPGQWAGWAGRYHGQGSGGVGRDFPDKVALLTPGRIEHTIRYGIAQGGDHTRIETGAWPSPSP